MASNDAITRSLQKLETECAPIPVIRGKGLESVKHSRIDAPNDQLITND